MNLKKFFAMILSVSLLMGMLAGCNNQQSGENSASPQTSNAGTEAENTGTQEKVKLSAIYIKHPLTKDFKEFKWLKEIEDSVGVEVEWQQISADWDQKKAPLLAGGDIPDLLFTAVVDADYATFNGLFEDLAPLIEQYGPNIQKMFEEVPETKLLAEQPDGKIYATPKYQRFWPKTNSTMFINKQWLDNLNLEVPTTWDELHQTLLAFRDGDPNGNGDKTDEIPLDFTGLEAYSPMMLLGATGIQLTNWGSNANGYFAEDGVVKNFWMDERYKELVSFVHKLYADGLINPEAFTADYSVFQSVARGEGDTAKVGFTWGWESTDRFGPQLASQYVPMAPLKISADSDIQPRWCYDYYALNMDGNRVSMSANCKNKEAAMKFIDAFYLPENSLQVLFGGISDGNIKKEDDGSYTILPPQDPSLDPGTWKWTNAFADGGPIYLPNDLEVTLGTDMQAVEDEKAVYEEAFTLLDEDKNVLPLNFIKFTPEDNNTLEINRANFRNVSDTWWAQFITEGGVEEGWDQYISELKASGIEQNNEIIQKYYDEYLASRS